MKQSRAERIPNLTGEQSDDITVFRIPPMTSLMLHRCRTGAINLQMWWQSPSAAISDMDCEDSSYNSTSEPELDSDPEDPERLLNEWLGELDSLTVSLHFLRRKQRGGVTAGITASRL
ncbi:hypothetical protein ANN_16143 [Periplaneta americana]|uniref:Uncharacterized protein n=1 Tax=Periplaneta americana TaxID=6978 RepID=A0ABQ8SJ38_PERAM|nr:hypothetical protein ANN_16143 [Periplaneta americana]